MARATIGLRGAQASEELRKGSLLDCEETEVEQGLRSAAPPMSENPDEADAGREHELAMTKAAAAAKPKPGAPAK